MAIIDEQDVLVEVNAAFAALVGRDESTLLGSRWWLLLHPQDVDVAGFGGAAADASARTRPPVRLPRPDGGVVWGELALIRLDDRAAALRLIQVEDVTARRQAEAGAARRGQTLLATIDAQRAVTAAAHDREQVLHVIAAHAVRAFPAADGAVVELVEGDHLDYVAAAGTLAAHLGLRLPIKGSLSGEAMSTRTTVQCVDSETDRRVSRDACRRVGLRSMCISPLLSGDRPIGVLKISSVTPAAFDNDDAYGLELLAASLSAALRHAEDYARNAALLRERSAALAALEASEQRFRVAFDNCPLGMVLISLKPATLGAVLQVNPAMTAITGYRADELTRMGVVDLHHREDIPSTVSALSDFASGEHETASLDRRYRHADGSEVWVRIRAAVAHDREGRPLYLVSQIEDITAARAAQAQLHQQARLLELIPAAVIVRDLDGTIRWWNAGAEVAYGWPATAALGKITHKLLCTNFPTGTSASADGGAAALTDALLHEGCWDGELEHLNADGHSITVLSRQVVQDAVDGTTTVLQVDTDITAMRAAQRALHESEQRFRGQFAHSAAGQTITALDHTYIEVNAAFAAMLGRAPEDLVGASDAALQHPDEGRDVQRRAAALFSGELDSATYEGRLRHAEGHWVDVETTVSMVRDTNRRPRHLITVCTDISARKAAERARDAAAAELAERNTELEAANKLKLDLIGMLGHEIGTPLATILGYTETAADDTDLGDEQRRVLDAISRSAHRLDSIVREVLTLVTVDAGRLTAHPEPLNVRRHLEAAIQHTLTDRPPAIDCPTELTAAAQAGHLDQILVNLLTNAEKYGGGATNLTARRHAQHIEIRVEDHGPGVPPHFRGRLFERLTRADTTAHAVNGTGLGLYIARELARANHGDLLYRPNHPRGSAFILRMPASPDPP
jgi:PAS domain S-box-containing protein